jgi:alpha-amylase/alpha-mannosidase (GH57 family)
MCAGPKLLLAILWHQHQPMYRDFGPSVAKSSFMLPWVRLHCIRDYYSMAALLTCHPNVHVTINLTPVLLRQIEAYVEGGCTDRALDLTLTPTSELTADDHEYIATQFFDADWHHEIYPHARYKQLLEKRGRGRRLNDADITDLRMWFNLAWFGPEFQLGEVFLPDETTASVRRFMKKGSFSEDEIKAMVAEQFRIMRNVVAIHKKLQDAGQLEVSTTPFYHPILPLVHDTGLAILDREGTTLPSRFSFPEDADAQIVGAIALYERLFARLPRGMWPAEGAVGESINRHLRRHRIGWIATDQGVLKRSGRWGYEAQRPEVLCKAWRMGDDDARDCVSIFFRDTELSKAIGFRYGQIDAKDAASDFIRQLKERYLPAGNEERLVSVILDGENAWGSYEQAGREFFKALYTALGVDPDICTVTFSEFLDGNPRRGVESHPLREQERVCDLAHASWIDECGSRPGNDLGTWIGEPEENAAWDLLREARQCFERSGITPQTQPRAFEAIYAAEGSDWFWWYGNDQTCNSEPLFDDLFRQHLRSAYILAGMNPPVELDQSIVPRIETWTFTDQKTSISKHDRLRFKVGCPGLLTWSVDGWKDVKKTTLSPSGGVMAGLNIYTATLGPFDETAHRVEFFFKCQCTPVCHCAADDLCCDQRRYTIRINTRSIG